MKEGWIKGVIFDLDGTLYTLQWMKVRMSFALLGSLGILRRLTAARAAVRCQTFDSKELLLEAMFAQLAARASISPEASKLWYEEQFLPAFVKILERKARQRDGLNDLLSLLKARDVRTAVVSDFGSVRQRLQALRVDTQLFDDLVAAEDYGVLKPSAAPLIALANKWKLSPTSVVVVGDREDTDMECAKRAGMGFIGVTEQVNNDKNSKFNSWKKASSKLETETETWSR